jgi:caffeoyl-CoA O-methyltransferase
MDGRLLCCDVSAEWTAVARRFWERAGLRDRIELRLAPALETLAALPREPLFDFAFVDAVKDEYVDYYEALVPRLTPRGIIAVDNVLRRGQVASAAAPDERTTVIRRFNDHVRDDPRTDSLIVPIGDGLSLITLAA